MALTTINSSGIKDDSIVNADIKSNAAIALSKLASTPAVLTGSTNNTICTVTGANSIAGESTLKWDGSALSTYRDSATTYGPGIIGHHQRGTIASPSVSQTDDTLLNIVAKGFDGTDYHDAARIDFVAGAGTPANNDMPGSIVFKTTDDGTGSSVTRLTIAQSGVIKLDDTATLLIPDAIQHTGDTNTQIRFPAADTVSVETGGTERLRVNSDGQFLLGSTANYGTIGTAAAFQIQGTNTGGNVSMNIVNAATSNASSTCDINAWQDYRLSTRIISGRENASNWTSSSSAAASYLAFYTNNAGTVAEKMRIHANGQVTVGSDTANGYTDRQFGIYNASSCYLEVRTASGNNNSGITFSKGTAQDTDSYRGYIAYNHQDDRMTFHTGGGTRRGMFDENGLHFDTNNNTAATGLDDYEEGEFTPGIGTSSGSVALRAANDTCAYTKIGDTVHVVGQIVIGTCSSQGGAFWLTGLPFTSGNGTDIAKRTAVVGFGWFNGAGAGSDGKRVWVSKLNEGSTSLNNMEVMHDSYVPDAASATLLGDGTDIWFDFTYKT